MSSTSVVRRCARASSSIATISARPMPRRRARVVTITFMTLALAAMALGLGVLFPQFRTENAAQIPTSFGGLVYMMLAVLLIGCVVRLEAGPVHAYLSAKTFGGTATAADMVLGFSLALVLCLAATLLPLSVAKRRLEEMEV